MSPRSFELTVNPYASSPDVASGIFEPQGYPSHELAEPEARALAGIMSTLAKGGYALTAWQDEDGQTADVARQETVFELDVAPTAGGGSFSKIFACVSRVGVDLAEVLRAYWHLCPEVFMISDPGETVDVARHHELILGSFDDQARAAATLGASPDVSEDLAMLTLEHLTGGRAMPRVEAVRVSWVRRAGVHLIALGEDDFITSVELITTASDLAERSQLEFAKYGVRLDVVESGSDSRS